MYELATWNYIKLCEINYIENAKVINISINVDNNKFNKHPLTNINYINMKTIDYI